MNKLRKIKWEKIESQTYVGINNIFSHHIRKEEEGWVLDIFLVNPKISTNKAYIETFCYESVEEAKNDAELYIEYLK